MKVIEKRIFENPLRGISLFSGDLVNIIGEQKAEYEGKELEQYIYNIVGYEPKNGLPFVGLKCNLELLK